MVPVVMIACAVESKSSSCLKNNSPSIASRQLCEDVENGFPLTSLEHDPVSRKLKTRKEPARYLCLVNCKELACNRAVPQQGGVDFHGKKALAICVHYMAEFVHENSCELRDYIITVVVSVSLITGWALRKVKDVLFAFGSSLRHSIVFCTCSGNSAPNKSPNIIQEEGAKRILITTEPRIFVSIIAVEGFKIPNQDLIT